VVEILIMPFGAINPAQEVFQDGDGCGGHGRSFEGDRAMAREYRLLSLTPNTAPGV
jgi:hypothetical protein